MRRTDPRAGFTLIEVLAALVITGAIVVAVLPYAARLATHWWVGEATVEAADGWIQALDRMGDDVAQAVPYGLSYDNAAPADAFWAGPDGIAFVRPALGDTTGLETVSYEIRPSPSGSALVRRNHRFDPAAFVRDVGGTSATLLDGPFRFRIVVVAADGTRRRDWASADGMPAAVELSAVGIGRGPVPAVPVLMPISTRAPAAANPAKTMGGSVGWPSADSR